ncbi:competence type IV pilus minor pilin ComGD [Paraliobacillus sediminis]|uniref:competence type IV pilus minor pilin ComGD n=1 Tax=Paraliobacillus sediminis TaxID=1885916 RepID=UPI000E3C5688|nr:competence type IV pilus minor pilin ComGD [Paraliobacillus sediminis]
MIVRKESGFTIVELLIVLSILSVLLIIGTNLHIKSYQNYQFNQWHQIFESDILFMQKLSITSMGNVYMLIKPSSHNYEIRSGGLGEIIIKRPIPEEWEIKLHTLSMPLTFSPNGTIQQPGRFQIITPTTRYDITFSFGKGRSYLIEK